MIANRATTAGKRPDRPVFTPVLFSACGEAAKGASAILDWIAWKFKARAKRLHPRLDGCRPVDLTKNFRRECHHTVMCHLAAGQGEMISWAGCPSLLHNNTFSRGVCAYGECVVVSFHPRTSVRPSPIIKSSSSMANKVGNKEQTAENVAIPQNAIASWFHSRRVSGLRV